MAYTESDVIEYVRENDVKFVKLTFCDLFGRQKNLSVTSSQIESAFRCGVAFNAATDEFLDEQENDLLLFPDPATLTALPWRPQTGRVVSMFCHIRYANGKPFEADGYAMLEQAVQRLQKFGLECSVGIESEFYIFRLDDDGNPTDTPYDRAGYLDSAPADKCENIRREIIFNIESMGMTPTSSHHEKGPGQNQIDFKQADPITSARNMLLFKAAVKNTCGRNGLYATFRPKPLAAESGSGLHFTIRLTRGGQPVFGQTFGDSATDGEAFLEGILSRAKELSMFTNPTAESYRRLGECNAPRIISWSRQNRSQFAKYCERNGEYGLKLRIADGEVNPFLVLALILHAGLDGIAEKLRLRPAIDKRPADMADAAVDATLSLPISLAEAVTVGEKSKWLKKHLGARLVAHYVACKRKETATE